MLEGLSLCLKYLGRESNPKRIKYSYSETYKLLYLNELSYIKTSF